MQRVGWAVPTSVVNPLCTPHDRYCASGWWSDLCPGWSIPLCARNGGLAERRSRIYDRRADSQGLLGFGSLQLAASASRYLRVRVFMNRLEKSVAVTTARMSRRSCSL
jgi:hypothetical protein